MTYRSGTRRPGISLLEVLTAIFIMGIGMMALLTLFPAGALSMARAVRDDRAAAMAANAIQVATAFDLRNDADVNTSMNSPAPTDVNGPGHPVFVDPHYVILGAGNLGGASGIRRAAPRYVRDPAAVTTILPQLVARYFTLQDEIEFDSLGHAKGAPGSVNRPSTYSLAYLVRRASHNFPEMTELSVVLYASRPTDAADGETTLTGITGMTGTNTITVTSSADFRRRSWLVDTTANASGIINAHFYRIENVTSLGSGQVQLELDRSLKDNMTSAVHLRDAIAVIERGSSW